MRKDHQFIREGEFVNALLISLACKMWTKVSFEVTARDRDPFRVALGNYRDSYVEVGMIWILATTETMPILCCLLRLRDNIDSILRYYRPRVGYNINPTK
ncbi:hypothetical protein BGZ60DRAFT_408294 [Tricladium varicosporioides]|nr:hypothetical protein BGZ60DRAFT_408294 [Hymenoscyphus varicosporioides]